ncbi:MAG: DUF1499 domain-containing protein [Cyanobacteria bacterium J06639_1]
MPWLKSIAAFAIALLLFGASAFTPAASAQTLPPGNSATQQITLNAPLETVRPAAAQAFEAWSRGELLNVDANKVTGVSRTNLFKFVDDIAVNLQADDSEPTNTRLDIVSVGRMGEYDFGGNQRNIDEYVATVRSLLSESVS